MSKRITQEELESYLWGSADLLRSHIDAGAYKQYIFPLLFFKRLNDVYEEETEIAIKENGPEAADWEETHSFVLPDDAHWDVVRNVPQDVGKAILAAFRAIEKANPDKLHGIFGDGTWTNKNRLPDRLLKDSWSTSAQRRFLWQTAQRTSLERDTNISSKSLRMIADIQRRSFTPTERLSI